MASALQKKPLTQMELLTLQELATHLAEASGLGS